jgi:hypothetical protein
LALGWFAPAVILAIGIVDVSLHPRSDDFPGAPGQHIAFLTVAVLALGLRTRAPLVAPFVAIGAVAWWSSLWASNQQGPFEGFLILVGAAYAIGSLNSGRRSRCGRRPASGSAT